MKRTTVTLPDGLDARIRQEARRRGVSIADVVREAIDRYLPAPSSAARLGFLAIGEADLDDASERVGELVGQSIRSRRTPPPTDSMLVR